MKNKENLTEFILVTSGEVVYAINIQEAREKLSRFNYTQEELQFIVTADAYENGTYLTCNGKFWA